MYARIQFIHCSPINAFQIISGFELLLRALMSLTSRSQASRREGHFHCCVHDRYHRDSQIFPSRVFQICNVRQNCTAPNMHVECFLSPSVLFNDFFESLGDLFIGLEFVVLAIVKLCQLASAPVQQDLTSLGNHY